MASKHLSLLALAVTTVIAGIAQASTVSLSNISAEWYEPSPLTAGGTLAYTDNPSAAPEVRWGDPASGSGKSGYDFAVAAQPITFNVPPSPSPNQVLGTFTHVNFPIYAGTSIDSIKLSITADVSIDSIFQNNVTFNYGFDHWETDNGARPCANGGTNGVGVNVNGCADRVIANWLSESEDFLIGSDIYTLNVIGFSLDSNGTNPFTSFWTKEGGENGAYLVGNVALRKGLEPDPSVPEPGTLALLGLGLIAWTATRRMKATKA